MSDVMDHALEICKLLKYLPRRNAILHELKEEISAQVPGLHNLCPTRWTVRAASLESIRLNYETLEATWEEALAVVRESEVKARINGVAAIMKTFDFLFGFILAERMLKHTDNLSKTMQTSSMSAVEAHTISQTFITIFNKIRNDLFFDQFWAFVEIAWYSLHISEHTLPMQQKRPRCYEDGDAEAYHPAVHYQQIYYQAINSIISTIIDSFNLANYGMYVKLEHILLLAATNNNYSTKLKEVVEFYKDDFNSS